MENSKNSKKNQQQSTSTQNAKDQNTLMAILSYIGPLVIVSYLTSKDTPFVKFHIKQGSVLFIIELLVWVLGMMIWILWPLLQIVNIAVIVLAIIGIMNAINKNEKPLPLVGSFSQYIKI